MIAALEVKNFKSIKELRLECKRLNIFIGEPNTGKSNILETLGLLSFVRYSVGSAFKLRDFVRLERTANLFYDENLDEALEMVWNGSRLTLRFQNGRFVGECQRGEKELARLHGDHADVSVDKLRGEDLAPFKFYRFAVREQFPRPDSAFLLPPSGDNLLSLLLSHRELRQLASQPFSTMGLRLGLRPHEHKIEVLKQVEDVIVAYPYHLASETLQRLIFYLAAIVSNKNSVLVFEEPESHAFPYYTKYLAETIALDKNDNQYFISTHNPYFLLPLVQKAGMDEIAVFITYYKDYQTRVKPLDEAGLRMLDEIDVFSNIETFLEVQ